MADSLRDHLVGAGYRVAWRAIRMLPESTAYRLGDAVAVRAWNRRGPRRQLVEKNLATVVAPELLEQTSREAFRAYARYWIETFRMQDLSREELAERFHTDGIEHIEKAHAAGTGGILVTMHFGNWDSGGRWVAERWPLVAVAEVLRPRSLFERFVEHRRRLGMEIIPLVRGADATAQCERHLRNGKLIALVADRDLSGSGIEVEMLGRRTKMPRGPAVLALRTGAPLIPAVIFPLPNGEWLAYVTEALPVEGSDTDPVAVAEVTQRIARRFEEFVRRDPTQWFAMFLRYWLDA